MVIFFAALYVITLFILAGFAVRVQANKKIDNRTLFLITIICMMQIVFSSAQFINVAAFDSESFVISIIHFSIGAVCACSDVILLLVLSAVLCMLKLRSQKTRAVMIVFGIFAAIDAIILLTNPITGFAFAFRTTPLWKSCSETSFFMPVNAGWLRIHESFNLLVDIVIFIALLLKSAKLPFIYTGKYILLATDVILIAILNAVYNFIDDNRFMLNYPAYLLDLIPLFLYHFVYVYRPKLMLFQLRRMVFENLGSPVILFDVEDKLADYNGDAAHLFALEQDQLNHLDIQDFLKRSMENQMRERSTSTVEEVSIRLPSGVLHVYKLDYTRLVNKHNHSLGTLLLFHDITELKKLYNTMEKTAMTDQLTGLASAALLRKKITEINLYRKYPYSAVVCNINGLRLISDGFGEDAGKAASMHVAELLKQQLRASDFAAYENGNMVVLMPDTEESEAETVFQRIAGILKLDRTFNFILSFEYGIAGRATPDTDMQLTVNQALSEMTRKKMLSSNSVHNSIVESLQDTLRMSSFETEQHSLRVKDLAMQLASKLKLSDEETEQLKMLALFHDIGKLSVPAAIMMKPSKLTEEERQLMDMHTINGYKIANISPELAPVARCILCHHEHWDGSGYPNSYAGEQIPYLARIISIVDAFDVMTHERPYKKAMTVEEAREEIKRNAGKQFDPTIVKVFLSLKMS